MLVWDTSEPLESDKGLLVFVSFTKTNTSFKTIVVNPVTGVEIMLYQHDVLEIQGSSYVLTSYRTSPLRFIFHKIIL